MIDLERSFILLIGDTGEALLPPQELDDLFPLICEGHEDELVTPFIEQFTEHPEHPIILVYDGPDQSYKVDEIPPGLSIFDRKRLLLRHLRECFYDHSHRGFLTIDERHALLLSAKETGPLALWAQRLGKLPNPSGTIGLLPIESTGLSKQLVPETSAGWSLLLSFHRTGGIRHTVTNNGAFVFTRLTPLLSEATSVGYMTSMIALDIKATRDYLARLGLGADEPLFLIGIVPQSIQDALNATPLDVSERKLFTPHEAAMHLHFPFVPEKHEPHADFIHLLWLGACKRSLSVELVKESYRLEMFHAVVRRGVIAALIVLTLLSGAGTAHESFLLASHIHRFSQIKGDVTQLQNDLVRHRREHAATTTPLDRLRLAMERRRLFERQESELTLWLSALRPVLDSEGLRLAHLDWQEGRLTFAVNPTHAFTPDPLATVRPYDKAKEAMRRALPPNTRIDLLSDTNTALANQTITNASGTSPQDNLKQITFEIRKEASP